MFNGQSTGVSQ